MSHLTAKDHHWFRIANAGHPSGFYPFKDRFLRRYGIFDGYCLQEIDQHCWTCEGSGFYTKDEPCLQCGGDGIFRKDLNWLECWQLGESTYHRPIDPIPHWQREGVKMHPMIYGRIKHTFTKKHPESPLFADIVYEISDTVARRAFYRLLLRHEPVNFFHQISDDIKRRLSNWRARHYWRLMKLRDKLDLFPAVDRDEVPF